MKKSKYSLPLEVMEKYIKKIEKKGLSQVKIMTCRIQKPYRIGEGIEYDTTKYDLVLIKREGPKK